MIGDSRIQHAANQYVGHGPEVDEESMFQQNVKHLLKV